MLPPASPPVSPLQPRHAALDRTRRLVFAHRGGAALGPENTLVAAQQAIALGADGLEIDVQLSADGEVVVIHDSTLERTTDGEGPVDRHSADALVRLDAGYHFRDAQGGHPFRGRGIGIPRLREVLERHSTQPIILELKGRDPALARAAIAVVRTFDAFDRVCFASFEDGTIEAVRAGDPAAVTSAAREEIRRALRRAWLGLPPRRPRFHAFQVPERLGRHHVATRRFVRAANRGRLPVQVWTVDDAAAMRRLLDWGVHAVITDRPDVAVPVVRAFNHPGAPNLDR